MKQALVISVFFVFVISSSACQKHKKQRIQQSETDTISIKASIDSLGGVVQRAHATKDSKLLASTWAKDGILIIAGNPPVYGRKAIVSVLGNMPQLPPGGKMEIHPFEVTVISPEWGYVLGIDSLRYRAPGATKQTIVTSTFFVLVRKTSEGWQTYRETLTPNQNIRKQQ